MAAKNSTQDLKKMFPKLKIPEKSRPIDIAENQ
jgi:hypothetical protein